MRYRLCGGLEGKPDAQRLGGDDPKCVGNEDGIAGIESLCEIAAMPSALSRQAADSNGFRALESLQPESYGGYR
jgi:hypothetical protein